ncbi:MAG: hypothetical protein WCL29_06740, partial [Pseudomonadota bacterium]
IPGLEPKQKVFDKPPPGKRFGRSGPPRGAGTSFGGGFAGNGGGARHDHANSGKWSKDGAMKSSFGKPASPHGKPAFAKFEGKSEHKFAGKPASGFGGKPSAGFVGKALPASTGGKDGGGWKKASHFIGK